MPQSKKHWDSFFNNVENKADLVRLALECFKSVEGRSHIRGTLVFTCENQCYKLTNEEVAAMPYLNHEEADSKIICRVCTEDTPVFVWAKDANIFVLLIYARSLKQPRLEWVMQIGHEFIDSI